QRARQRRIDADAAGGRVGLVRADDAVAGDVAAVDVFQFDGGTEEHGTGIRWRLLNHPQRRQALAQVAHAPVDLAQLLLAVAVLRILGAVALGRGRGQRRDHFGPAHPPQFVQLGLQPCVALAGDQRGAFFRGRAPAGHVVSGLAGTRCAGAGSAPAEDLAEDAAHHLVADLAAVLAAGLAAHRLADRVADAAADRAADVARSL